MKKLVLTLLVVSFGYALPTRATMDGFALEVGSADDIDTVRASLAWQWNKEWLKERGWHLTGYWEGSLGYWNSRAQGGESLWDVALGSVFRLRPNASGGTQPYLEGAIAAHLLSGTHLDDQHRLGSALQLGNHIGIGVTFGDKSQYDMSYRLRHLSNGGIQEPNDELSQHQIRFAYNY